MRTNTVVRIAYYITVPSAVSPADLMVAMASSRANSMRKANSKASHSCPTVSQMRGRTGRITSSAKRRVKSWRFSWWASAYMDSARIISDPVRNMLGAISLIFVFTVSSIVIGCQWQEPLMAAVATTLFSRC